MLVSEVSARLRERLGTDATNGLLEALERTRDESVTAAMTSCGGRFERRLVETSSALRLEVAGEMCDGFSALREEIAVHRADHEALMQAVQLHPGDRRAAGVMVACIEEIACRLGYIRPADLAALARRMESSAYGQYLSRVLGQEP